LGGSVESETLLAHVFGCGHRDKRYYNRDSFQDRSQSSKEPKTYVTRRGLFALEKSSKEPEKFDDCISP
ncbi:hypothetical protein RUM43_010433, partial [Polyplax serrata]